MIRLELENHWLLLPHHEHARLAGEFARHWKNDEFLPPEPFAHVLDAVSRHDDSWEPRDAEPELTAEGRPSAFSRELVGTYSAFEEIDLRPYLEVRAGATEKAAARDAYAAILISMHTVNLLTEQADLDSLTPENRTLHAAFVRNQKRRQEELRQKVAGKSELAPYVGDKGLNRAFAFLQACDSLSLNVAVDYEVPGTLRHKHPRRNGETTVINYERLKHRHYRLFPWPFDEPELSFEIPYRRVTGKTFKSTDDFRSRYQSSAIERVAFKLSADPL